MTVISPALARMLNIRPQPPAEEDSVKASQFYQLRQRATRDLQAAEEELEVLEEEASLPPAAREHARLALDRVRKALCTTMVMQLGETAQ